jgi:hypothetical protein
MPDEEPRAAVLADAQEELSLGGAALDDVRAIAVCVNDTSGSALVVYHALLKPGAEPSPDERKVAELHWARTPAALGAQVSGDTVACWQAVERWRETLREPATA